MQLKKNSENVNPLISILTVVYNCVDTLEQTIKSVLSQTYFNIDYIIIDGGSTDGTIDIIKRYAAQIKYWVSEKDQGIFDAMNKGIKLVNDQNSYILFLNADDYLYSQTSIEKIVSNINNEDFLYGKILSTGASASIVLGKELTYYELPLSMIQHQASFAKKKLFTELGGFNTSYKIAADFEFGVRVMEGEFKHKFINEIVAVMRMGGASSINYRLTFKEKSNIINLHYKGFVRFKALFYYNLYERPKHAFSNILYNMGLLGFWRRFKTSILNK